MAIVSTIEAFLPLVLATSALIGISLSWWPVRLPRVAFVLLAASLLTGQVVRYSLPGQGGGLMVSDIAVVLMIVAVVLQVVKPVYEQHSKDTSSNLLKSQLVVLLIIPFLLWSLVGLVLNGSSLETGGLFIAGSYWIRLSVYLLLLPSLMWVFSQKVKFRNQAITLFTGLILMISVLGFIQLWVFPDLSIVTDMGWDPHQKRLVSTWLDPNLLAGFFVMTLPFMVWQVMTKKYNRVVSVLFIAIPLLALLMTQSRSGLLALIGMALIIMPLWLIRWLKTEPEAKAVFMTALLGLAMGVIFFGALMLGDRAIGLVSNDATVQLRADALTRVWAMAEEASLFGTGYNAYQFAALEAGLIGDFTIHSRGGADNSWLTLWVTTGIMGILLWLLPWLFLLHLYVKQWLKEGHYVSLVAIAAFVSLFIHSQFVNSFLYGHLLITLIVIFSLANRRDPVR